MNKLFLFLYNSISKQKKLSIFVLAVIIGVATFFASKIKLVEDISKVIPKAESINNMNFVFNNSKFMDKIIFNVKLTDTMAEANPQLLIRYADELADSLSSQFEPDAIKKINSKFLSGVMLDIYDLFYNNLPLFLEKEDYQRIDSLITYQNISETVGNNYKTLISPAGFAFKKTIKKDPLSLTPIALKKLKGLQFDDKVDIYNDHFLTKDKKSLIFFVTPSQPNNTALNDKLLKNIDNLIDTLSGKYNQEITSGYFGSVAVAVGNANRIKKDITLTVTISLILLILFISIFFRKKWVFLKLFLPVIGGAVISIAVLYIVKTEVSVMSLAIGSVLLGISVDYALHVFSHNRSHGSIKNSIEDLSTPILMSSLTTASAFFCLLFISSEALNDLGLFAGVSVIVAALFSIIILPHLIKNKNQVESVPEYNNTIIDKIANFDFTKSKSLLFGIVSISILFIFFIDDISFESDLMKNNYMSDELKQAEKEINKISGVSLKTIYLVSHGKTMEEALSKNEEISIQVDSLKNEHIVKKSTVLSSILRSKKTQQKYIDNWNNFWNDKKIKHTKESLINAGNKYRFKENSFSDFYELLNKEFKPVELSEFEKLRTLFFDDYIIETEDIFAIINLIEVERNNTEVEKVYNTFSQTESIWIFDRQLLTSEFVSLLKENFDKLIYISLSIVFLILLIAYGRIEIALITFFPMLLSWVWTIGIMGILGIKFNIFNIIISTFIFGLGIDYSIFITRGLILNYKYGYKNITSYKVSIILSAITTILGIGVLVFAKHPALQSIATLSIIGILSVIIVAFTIQPILFKWLVENKHGKRKAPLTLLDFVISIFTFLIFLVGSLSLTAIIPLFLIFPAPKKSKKLVYHYLLTYFARFIVKVNVFSSTTVTNINNEDFKKPAVIIANHQSHLDLMVIMMLTPHLIIITNNWVWNNPFYGFVVKYAEYYPVTEGYETALEKLSKKVEEGYSILIFPEGTRSETDKIKRFYKGAFLLAEKLKIDIQPIIIHGTHDCLSKREFFLKRGQISLKVLPRIDLSLKEYGENYSRQTKAILKYFREEYDIFKKSIETPDHFRRFIVNNYLYKGPILEWYLKVKIRLEKNYVFFNNIIPEKCSVLDIGCGYGFLPYMLSLTSSEREIHAIDYDKKKITVAQNGALKNDNINFEYADVLNYEPGFKDIFILNDILHYMPKDKQIEIIEKCISNLNPNGKIIIRDANKDLNKRHKITKLTEFFSTKFGFNIAQFNQLFFISRNTVEELAAKHNMKIEAFDNTKVTSNIIYIIQNSQV